MLVRLRDAHADGLDPQAYRIDEIETRLKRRQLKEADKLLSQAYFAYARDLRVPRNTGSVTYVDRELAPSPPSGELSQSSNPVERLGSLQRGNPLYEGLRERLAEYRARWSGLPKLAVPPGPNLSVGDKGERVALLRRRFGLSGSDVFDGQLGEVLREFRAAHGLSARAVADDETIAALNLGPDHYERLIAANLDRVRSFPTSGRYIVVDTAGAQLRLIEDGRIVDRMRVVVGKRGMETPEMAGLIRFALINPYWNVPPDLVRRSVAPEVVAQGQAALARRRLAVFPNWKSFERLDPASVDWAAVRDGRESVWLRQMPGGDNMMGEVKFMLPNRLGIYLHDTPHKSDFARSDRRLSSGCVRVEDARRLARWLFGRSIFGGVTTPETRIDLPEPVPVYITYLTAVPEDGRIRFQDDVYRRDPALLAQLAANRPIG